MPQARCPVAAQRYHGAHSAHIHGNKEPHVKVIDCHCHIYPEKIAAVAAQSVASFYSLDVYSPMPTGEQLLRSC